MTELDFADRVKRVAGPARRTAFRAAMTVAPPLRQRIARSKLNPRWYRWAHAGTPTHWEKHGKRQFEFLTAAGLQPSHEFLDVGCGPLRAGLHFIRYLEPNRYSGMDVSPAFLKAGQQELDMAGLADKDATLILDGDFRFNRFERKFDFALAQSVFTHLPFNSIMRCLGNMEEVLNPGGKFYATFTPNGGTRLRRDSFWREGLRWHLDRDPFYYDPDIFAWAVKGSSLAFEYVGAWGHPADQEMLVFTKSAEAKPSRQ